MIFRIFIDEAVAIPRVGSRKMATHLADEIAVENPGCRVTVCVRRRRPEIWAQGHRWDAVMSRCVTALGTYIVAGGGAR